MRSHGRLIHAKHHDRVGHVLHHRGQGTAPGVCIGGRLNRRQHRDQRRGRRSHVAVRRADQCPTRHGGGLAGVRDASALRRNGDGDTGTVCTFVVDRCQLEERGPDWGRTAPAPSAPSSRQTLPPARRRPRSSPRGAGSWVLGVGNDWDGATARTVPANQTIVHQYLATTGDTFWVQRLTNSVPASGTTGVINDTAPTNHRYNLAVVEVLLNLAPDTTPPAVTSTGPANGAAAVMSRRTSPRPSTKR